MWQPCTCCYLGIVFSAMGNFKAATEKFAEQAQKAVFKLKQLNIRDNVSLPFKLSQCLIHPSYSQNVMCDGDKGLQCTNLKSQIQNIVILISSK